jgi:hypothetical protein
MQPSQQARTNNPAGAITLGSSKDHVREVMGNPDSIILTSCVVVWKTIVGQV